MLLPPHLLIFFFDCLIINFIVMTEDEMALPLDIKDSSYLAHKDVPWDRPTQFLKVK